MKKKRTDKTTDEDWIVHLAPTKLDQRADHSNGDDLGAYGDQSTNQTKGLSRRQRKRLTTKVTTRSWRMDSRSAQHCKVGFLFFVRFEGIVGSKNGGSLDARTSTLPTTVSYSTLLRMQLQTTIAKADDPDETRLPFDRNVGPCSARSLLDILVLPSLDPVSCETHSWLALCAVHICSQRTLGMKCSHPTRAHPQWLKISMKNASFLTTQTHTHTHVQAQHTWHQLDIASGAFVDSQQKKWTSIAPHASTGEATPPLAGLQTVWRYSHEGLARSRQST